jgi:hypothetical protein
MVEDRSLEQQMADAQAEAQYYWNQCCQVEGIDPESFFVVFDIHNPYRLLYYDAVAAFMSARAMLQQQRYTRQNVPKIIRLLWPERI